MSTHRQTDPWVKVGIAGTLAYLWRGPLKVLLLGFLLILGAGMLISPVWTLTAVGAVLGLVAVHHVRQREGS